MCICFMSISHITFMENFSSSDCRTMRVLHTLVTVEGYLGERAPPESSPAMEPTYEGAGSSTL